ncbi:hypothetical protein PO909_004512 [Leuciscus waleckii]
MMGRKGKKTNPIQSHNASFADELNVFFGRFDTGECSTEVDRICSDIPLYENITLEEHEIAYCLSRTKLNKAPGPDGLNGRVLKDCVYQLTGVFTQLFQLLLSTRIVPNLWKVSTVVPVPKITGAKGLNDFRPISLTSVLGKCMERVIMRHLMYFVSDVLDPLQFAYKKARGTDDAVLTLYNSVAEHVQLTSNYARIFFLDFTSAFNTMKIHILIQRLIDLGVNGGLIWWIKDFLSNRPQRVAINGKLSGIITLNTGAPQGAILSPILFSLYINEYKIKNEGFSLLKYADDMALVGLMKVGENTDSICKKAHQRLHLIRRLNHFGVSKIILEMVYKNFVESILVFNMTSWYGNLTVVNKARLSKIVIEASKIIGKTQRHLNDLYRGKSKEKALKIVGDVSHPLHSKFQLLPSGRRYRQPRVIRKVYQLSFVPNVVKILNGND